MDEKINIDLNSIFEPVADELEQVKGLIAEQLSDCHEALRPLVKPFVNSKGKLLRPAFLLLSGKSCGVLSEKHICAAATVEMIHDATLLHDDVIDHGMLRRGEATVNYLYGNESAVLLGDFFLTRVFRMITDLDSRVLSLVAQTAANTCEGELRQVLSKRNWEIGEEEYIDMIANKTAALFGCCCQSGAMLSGASDEEALRFGRFGKCTGIAFQITDDLLDIVGVEKHTGKTSGRDVEGKKLTLSLIHLLNEKSGGDRNALIGRLEKDEIGDDELKRMLDESGSIAYARRRSQEFTEEAIKEIAGVPENAAKKNIIELSRFASARFH